MTLPGFELVDTFMGNTKYATHDIGQASRNRHPHSAWCLRCGLAYPDKKDAHSVRYKEGSGMTPICGTCWGVSTPQERFEYCKCLFRSWLTSYMNNAFNSNINPENHQGWLEIKEQVAKECGL